MISAGDRTTKCQWPEKGRVVPNTYILLPITDLHCRKQLETTGGLANGSEGFFLDVVISQ